MGHWHGTIEPRLAGDPNAQEDNVSSSSAPGWDSITAACDRTYPRQPDPAHHAPVVRWALGGNDPLEGISIYRAQRPVPHWHYVGYGLTDLFTDDPLPAPDEAVSGFGFELTFRLADPAVTDPTTSAPSWPMNLLQNLARYVVTTGNALDRGHHLDARSRIVPDSNTALTAYVFGIDPGLGEIVAPRGRVTFLLVEGVTAGELSAMQRWNSDAVVALIRRQHPGGVTDLGRRSITDDPAVVEIITTGAVRDGSEQGLLAVQSMTVVGSIVTVTKAAVAQLLQTLPGRLPHGRPLLMRSPQASVTFTPSTDQELRAVGGDLTLPMSPSTLADLTHSLSAAPGTYDAAGITWHVTD